MAAWNAIVSSSCWVRRRSSTGVRSAPPPNHALVVTTKRVFMCTAGTFGLRICGIIGGAGNLRAKLGREFAVYRRAMDADLLEQPSAHHRHHAAAAGLAGVVGAVPWRAYKAPRGPGIERCRRIVFQFLEGQADVVAQGFE